MINFEHYISNSCDNHFVGVAGGFIGTGGAAWVLLQVNPGAWEVVGKVIVVFITVVVAPTFGLFAKEYYSKKIRPKVFGEKKKSPRKKVNKNSHI